MIRAALIGSLSVLALALAARTALVQVHNYEVAAHLDSLARGLEWNARRASGLRPLLSRFAFDLLAEQTHGLGEDVERPSR